MKPEEIRRILPRASQETIRLNTDDLLSSAKPQHGAGNEQVEEAKTQTRNTRRCIIRVTSYRVRLLDEDNLVPKWHIDSLRYAGILHSDAPDQTEIVTTQKNVAHKNQEKTLIQITWPE